MENEKGIQSVQMDDPQNLEFLDRSPGVHGFLHDKTQNENLDNVEVLLKFDPMLRTGTKFGAVPEATLEGLTPKELKNTISDLVETVKGKSNFGSDPKLQSKFLASHKQIKSLNQLALGILDATRYLAGGSAREAGKFYRDREETRRTNIARRSKKRDQLEPIEYRHTRIKPGFGTKVTLVLVELSLAVTACGVIVHPTKTPPPSTQTSSAELTLTPGYGATLFLVDAKDSAEVAQIQPALKKEFDDLIAEHPEVSQDEITQLILKSIVPGSTKEIAFTTFAVAPQETVVISYNGQNVAGIVDRQMYAFIQDEIGVYHIQRLLGFTIPWESGGQEVFWYFIKAGYPLQGATVNPKTDGVPVLAYSLPGMQEIHIWPAEVDAQGNPLWQETSPIVDLAQGSLPAVAKDLAEITAKITNPTPEPTATQEQRGYTLEQWKNMIFSSVFKGDIDGTFPMAEIFSSERVTFITTTQEMEDTPKGVPMIILKPNGEIQVWSNHKPAVQMVSEGAIAVVPKPGMEGDFDLIMMSTIQIAGQQYRQGNKNIHVIFGETGELQFIRGFNIYIKPLYPKDDRLLVITDENGKKVVPIMDLPVHFLVRYLSKNGQVSPTKDMYGADWYQIMVNKGVYYIAVYPIAIRE